MIDKLAFLLALAREQHFGRAAASCGVTQPSLSAGIKQLEATLGVLLVQRGGRFGGFTPEGERVLEWARRIVGDARAMREEVRAAGHGLRGHLRLAVIPTCLPMVVRLTTPLRDRHPEITFSIRSCTSHEVLEQMENLEADAGLTYAGAEKLGRVRHLDLFEETYCLVVSRDSPLAARAQVGWSDIASLPLGLLTLDMQNRRIIDRRLNHGGDKVRPVLESNSMIVLVSHVRTGRWASIMPSLLAQELGAQELGADETGAGAVRAVPIADPESGPMIGLVYPHREPLAPMTAALLAEARRLLPMPMPDHRKPLSPH